MTEFFQPVAIALLVLLVPATSRYLFKRISQKLDEGRLIALADRKDMAALLAAHRHELVTQLDLIKEQTTRTNGTVSRHTKELVRLTARTDVLMELYLKGKAD